MPRAGDGGTTWQSVVVEGYTNQDRISAPQGPGTYGPLIAISPDEAVFIGFTPPADFSTTMMLATGGGSALSDVRPVPVTQFSPYDADFLSADHGWIVGRMGEGKASS